MCDLWAATCCGDNAFKPRIFFHRRQSTANNVFVHSCALLSPRLWPAIRIVTGNEILNGESHINQISCSHSSARVHSSAQIIPLIPSGVSAFCRDKSPVCVQNFYHGRIFTSTCQRPTIRDRQTFNQRSSQDFVLLRKYCRMPPRYQPLERLRSGITSLLNSSSGGFARTHYVPHEEFAPHARSTGQGNCEQETEIPFHDFNYRRN